MERENDGVNVEQLDKIIDAALSLKQSIDPEKLPFLDHLVNMVLVEIEDKIKIMYQVQT